MLYGLLCGHRTRFCYRHSRESSSSSNGTVGQFDTKGGLPKLELFKARAGSLPYPAELLFCRRNEQNNIGLTRREAQHAATGRADEDRWMWLLHWPGKGAQTLR